MTDEWLEMADTIKWVGRSWIEHGNWWINFFPDSPNPSVRYTMFFHAPDHGNTYHNPLNWVWV